MKPRFEPDVPASEDENASASLIDPEAYDASEQQFAASLEQPVSSSQPRSLLPRFIVEDEVPERANRAEQEKFSPAMQMSAQILETVEPARTEAGPDQAPVDPDSWRREVAERLNHYRARRRTREPRYPSLQLKFEPDPISSTASVPMEPLPPPPQSDDLESS